MRLMAGDIGRPPLAAPLALFRPACSASRRSSASRSAASCRTIRQLPNNATVQHFIHLRLTDYLGEYNRHERVNLFWRVRGSSGEKYTIKIEPEEGRLIMEGKHPIELAIAKGFTAGGGHRFFTLTRKPEKE